MDIYGDEPVVSQMNVFSNQVCVPKSYTDAEAIAFLESEHPAGTTGGWFVKEDLGRVQCEEREGFVHLVLYV